MHLQSAASYPKSRQSAIVNLLAVLFPNPDEHPAITPQSQRRFE